ncbi:MAG: histidine kinase N-terminal 7TM domain-containing protein [Haloarculaceae archaeon]
MSAPSVSRRAIRIPVHSVVEARPPLDAASVYFPADSPLFLAHFFGLVVTALVSGAVARWVHRCAEDRAGTVMVYLLGTHVLIAVVLMAELVTPSLGVRLALSGVWYFFVLTNPVAFFLLAVYYTGREHWLTRPVLAALSAFALLVAATVATNPVFNVLFTDAELAAEPFLHLSVTPTPFNVAFLAGSWLFTLAGFGLLFRMALFSRRASRWQLVALLVGMGSMIASVPLSVSSSVPVRNFPYGIYVAAVFAVLVAVALFRSRLFGVAAIARDSIFESVGEAVVVIDSRRRIVDFNAAAAGLFPAIASEVGSGLGEAYPELVGSADLGDDSPAANTFESVVVDDDSPFVGSLRRSVDGEERTFSVTASEVTRGDRIRGYGLVFRDVTPVMDYATELERETERLEQFASVLSHDLRNPVQIAAGRLQLELDERDSANLETAFAAVERIETTIDDLLALAREGDRIRDPEPVSLASAVSDAWETTDSRGVALTVAVDDDFRLVADRSRLLTLLENLFRNVADHGGDRATVGVLEDGSGFFVADDGPGFSAADSDRLFEYGYSTAADGTGLGLAIVASVAEAHGWSVSVTDSEEGGARFEVTGVERVGADGSSDRTGETDWTAGAGVDASGEGDADETTGGADATTERDADPTKQTTNPDTSP